MPHEVATIRREVCTRAGCEHRPDYADPCASCPAGHWRPFVLEGCAEVKVAAAPPVPPVIASADWPFMMQPMKLLARAGDRGLGDVVARVVGPVGGDAFKAWHQRVYGRSCGCGDRQLDLNRRYPLTP